MDESEIGMQNVMDLSVVIPVFRSQDHLRSLVQRLLPVLDGTGLSYEVVFVDDGSPDNSWQVLNELQRERPDCIVAFQLMRNYGQHNALMCGFRHCRGRLIATMDDDLQNPPEALPALLEELRSRNLDLVYGAPRISRHDPGRNIGSALVHAFYRFVFKTPVTISSFRVLRRELVDSILTYSLNFTIVDGLLAWNTTRIGQVSVEHDPRRHGRSGYSFCKLVVHALNLFTNFSLIPLQLISATGFAAAGCGLIVAAYSLTQYFLNNIAVPGYASIIVSVLVLGGIQLLSLGVMGEYLGRLHLNVNRKPQYTIRNVSDARVEGFPPRQTVDEPVAEMIEREA